jgi:hypothetical protein
MSNLRVQLILLLIILLNVDLKSQIFAGADETTPSRSQYFSWINNTNEGTTEEHTLINFNFFEWLKSTYGMQLDIYAFDAGAIDGAKFYGKVNSERFKKQFPNSFNKIYEEAKNLGFKLGVWGGPDGFGNSKQEAQDRIDMMVKLCKDFEFDLFKFDKVCGPLPLSHEDYFITMMKECRKYSPNLILLNHRLGLKKSLPYATTFLWEGVETYIDCHIWNPVTAPHHRVGSLFRGHAPNNSRLTEDHGVCLSSCLDAWDDELILQAFHRNLILAPQIYGNPWLLRDNEYPKLARIFNLHKKFRKILINSTLLSEKKYGFAAVSRGDDRTRFLVLRNLSWQVKKIKIDLDKSIGLSKSKSLKVFVHHPNEKYLGNFSYGSETEVEILPFKTCLIRVTSEPTDEIFVKNSEYRIENIKSDNELSIKVLKPLGDQSAIEIGGVNLIDYQVSVNQGAYKELTKTIDINNDTKELKKFWHRKLSTMKESEIPKDAICYYESTCFAADNNALEVRSLNRSGTTNIKAVKEARDAFFSQPRFIERGVWDKYMFDGNLGTSFYVSRRRYKDMKINGGCLRVDFGKQLDAEKIVINYPDVYALQPLEPEEGIYVYLSNDLMNWEKVTGYIGDEIQIPLPSKKYRYMKIPVFPERISEINAYKNNLSVYRNTWRASNLFADYSKIEPKSAMKSEFVIDEVYKGAYLCVAINGEHGNEGAYAAIKVDGKYIGANDRSISFPSNTWESAVCHKDNVTKNYTYYIPLEKWMESKKIEAYVLINSKAKHLKPEVWITSHNKPAKEYDIKLRRK